MISTDISDDSVVHFLRTVGPILDFQLDLQRCSPLDLGLSRGMPDIVVASFVSSSLHHRCIVCVKTCL